MYRPLDHPLLRRLREQVLYSAGPIGSTLLSYNLGPEAYVAADEIVPVDMPEARQLRPRAHRPEGVTGVLGRAVLVPHPPDDFRRESIEFACAIRQPELSPHDLVRAE